MTFLEDMQGCDLALLQTLDGREITYRPADGVARTVAGMLQEFSELTAGETVDVVTAKPVL